ncbi:MAG: hypothetical protein HC894_08160 [Microcoleus sp. SM1_3_4]|nr:hypothetical protein [Microcoleus sp. SM1_3_4]
MEEQVELINNRIKENSSRVVIQTLRSDQQLLEQLLEEIEKPTRSPSGRRKLANAEVS